MNIEPLEIEVRGQKTKVPSAKLDGCTVFATGSWLKTAQLFDEELIESGHFPDPRAVVSQLRDGRFPADVFTFARPGEAAAEQYEFPSEWDNLAVVPTSSFDDWWNGLPQETRKNTRLAAKRGVVVKAVTIDDSLVRGIKDIYDESPMRQGKRFWHHGKDLETVRAINSTYPDRSQFVGAFVEDKLVGFIRYVRVDRFAVIVQIIAMESQRDKKPINALLTHTIEVCQSQGMATLTYGKFDYGVNKDSSLTEFKRRNGFSELRFRRYFAPLTPQGRFAVSTGLHLGIRNVLPLSVTTFLHKARARALRILRR